MIAVNGRKVGPGYPAYFVAEIGINHNGSLDMALELIKVAALAGVDAVKFQKRTVDIVYSREELDTPREFDRSILDNALGRQEIEGVHYEVFPPDILAQIESGGPTTNRMLKLALEFGLKEFDIINRECQGLGISWSASAWDGLSAHFVNGFEDVHWLKVASACLTNRDLLRRVEAKGKPVFLSTGGSTLEEIGKAVDLLGRENLVLLHCVAAYPPADEETNLLVIETLGRAFPGVPVGFSSHARDIFPAVAAVMIGASVVEVHLTLDRNLPGSDHGASLEPQELTDLVNQVRRLEILRGDGIKRVIPSEAKTMTKLRRIDDL